MNLKDLPAFRSESCKKCGEYEDIHSTWMSAQDWRGESGESTASFTTSGEEDDGGHDLMNRECKRCGYVWWELPLDSDLLEDGFKDPRDAEIRALRLLITEGMHWLDTDAAPPMITHAFQKVYESMTPPASDQTVNDPPMDIEVEIEQAAPDATKRFFGELRAEALRAAELFDAAKAATDPDEKAALRNEAQRALRQAMFREENDAELAAPFFAPLRKDS